MRRGFSRVDFKLGARSGDRVSGLSHGQDPEEGGESPPPATAPLQPPTSTPPRRGRVSLLFHLSGHGKVEGRGRRLATDGREAPVNTQGHAVVGLGGSNLGLKGTLAFILQGLARSRREFLKPHGYRGVPKAVRGVKNHPTEPA